MTPNALTETYLAIAIATMRSRGVVLEDGLTNEEVRLVERLYGFPIPPDLRLLFRLANLTRKSPVALKPLETSGGPPTPCRSAESRHHPGLRTTRARLQPQERAQTRC